MNFAELRSRWNWSAIPNCPGRFILRENGISLSPEDIVGPDTQLNEFQVENARDTVVVGRIGNGGLISYRRKDGTYIHTLNTVAGFERKLTKLDIRL